MTLTDVARVARVSTATVSLVLSGKAEGRVSTATARKVRTAAHDLGYVRNAVAASMRHQRTRTIGVLAEQVLSTPYAVAMIEAILAASRGAGWSVLLTDSGADSDQKRLAAEELRSRQVDIVIHAAMYHQEVVVDAGFQQVAVLNGFADRPGVPGVVPDEEAAAYEATSHLIGLGHTRIAHVTDTSSAVAVRMRINGYRRALGDHGLEVSPDLVIHGGNDPSGADVSAGRALDLAPRPTAVFCYNDGIAAGVYRIARRRGLDIPRDLSVVGFDDLRLISENLDPALTTMRLPHYEMADWLTRHLIGDTGTVPTGITRMPCELVVRASTTAPPS